MHVHHNYVVLFLRLYFTLEGSQVLLDLEDFKVFLRFFRVAAFLLDQIEHSDQRILLLIDRSNNFAVANELVFGKGGQ